MLNPALEIEDQTNTVSLVVAMAEYAAGFEVDSTAAIGKMDFGMAIFFKRSPLPKMESAE